MRTATLVLLVLPLTVAWHGPAVADAAFEPTTWFTEAIQRTLVANQHAIGMAPMALSPHDPPQLFVGVDGVAPPRRLTHGVFHCWADGSRLRLLVTGDDEMTYEAAWSPDGCLVACATARADGTGTGMASAHLWVLDIVSGQRWSVSRDYAFGLQWQPDSRGLLYWRYVKPEDGSELNRSIAAPEGCRVTAPWEAAQSQALNLPRVREGVFSPDARQVAYWGHLPEEGVDGPRRVLIADVATGQVRSLEDKQTLRVFQHGPGGLDKLAWSPDGLKLYLQVHTVMMETTTPAQFIVDVPTGAYRSVPTGLGSHLQPVDQDLSGRPPVKRLERPKEARWVDATWIPGTHKLLCVLWDTFGLDAWSMMAAGGMHPQYAAWVVVDADSGQVEPVHGLPSARATAGPWGGGFGMGAGHVQWSQRTLHLQNDITKLYRMK